MEKVYLKFRSEVLAGNYLLFQVLEMDERFRDVNKSQISFETDNGIELYSYDSPTIYHNIDRICLRGYQKGLDFMPVIVDLSSTNNTKDQMLTALSQFWKWEGFKDDFYKPNIEIFKSATYLNVDGEICFLSELGLNAKRFIFRKHSDVANGYDIFLDYQIWERNEFTFMKVNYADDYFRIYSFSNKGIDDNITNSPFMHRSELKFKGTLPEYDFNVVGSYDFRTEIDDINNQVLKFLNEKFKPKKPELVDLGNNVYEVRG